MLLLFQAPPGGKKTAKALELHSFQALIQKKTESIFQSALLYFKVLSSSQTATNNPRNTGCQALLWAEECFSSVASLYIPRFNLIAPNWLIVSILNKSPCWVWEGVAWGTWLLRTGMMPIWNNPIVGAFIEKANRWEIERWVSETNKYIHTVEIIPAANWRIGLRGDWYQSWHIRW